MALENRSLSVFTETVNILERMATRGSVEEQALREDLVGMHRVRLFARPTRRDETATSLAANRLAKQLREEYGGKLQVIVVIGSPLDERFGS
jgi:hypothetical protein